MPVTCGDDRNRAEGKTFGEALQLGRLLASVKAPIDFDENGLPVLLDGCAIADWDAQTKRRLSQRFGRSASLAERTAEGRDIRRSILKVLQRLQNGSSAAGLTRKQIATLRQLVLLCARDQDWASVTGPIVGASNSEISRRIGGRDPGEALKPLTRRGLISSHKRRGNGHRYFRVINKGQDNETVDASGLSLGPLVVLLDALVVLANYEEELVEQHIALPRQITATLNKAKDLVAPFLDSEWGRDADERVRAISVRSHNGRKCSIERKRALLSEASDLLEQITAHAEAHQPEEYSVSEEAFPDPVGGGNTTHLYSESYGLEDCRGYPVEKDESDGPSSQSSASPEDAYGIERVGFEWREVPHLFPFTAGMIEIDPRYLRPAVLAVGRTISIADLTIVENAIGAIGVEATLLALLVTGQHLADNKIERSPAVYFRGLVRRGRHGDLNLGHTIFGRRELANLNSSGLRCLRADKRPQRIVDAAR